MSSLSDFFIEPTKQLETVQGHSKGKKKHAFDYIRREPRHLADFSVSFLLKAPSKLCPQKNLKIIVGPRVPKAIGLERNGFIWTPMRYC